MGKKIKVTVVNADGVRNEGIEKQTSETAYEIIQEFLGFNNLGGDPGDYHLNHREGEVIWPTKTLEAIGVRDLDTLTVVKNTSGTAQSPAKQTASPTQTAKPASPPPPHIVSQSPEPPYTPQGKGLTDGGKQFLVVMALLICVFLFLFKTQPEIFAPEQFPYQGAEPEPVPVVEDTVKRESPPAIPAFVPPALSFPVNDEIVQKDQPIQLRWQEVPRAVKYSLKVNNTKGEEILLTHQSGTDYVLNKSRMEPEDGTISWSVNAFDSQGKESGWSNWARFSLAESAAQAPASDNPPAQAQVKPEKYFPFPDDKHCAPSRLHVGDNALVKPEANSLYVRCYEDTHPPDNILYTIYPTEKVKILGGPVCNYGWILWEIPCDHSKQYRNAVCYNPNTCWIAETDNGDKFWLEPVGPGLAVDRQTVSSTCPDNASVHLSVGVRGKIVFSDVSLRTSAEVPSVSNENVIVILKQGAGLTVIGGPTCVYNGTWWQVETDAGDTGWVRELMSDKRLVEISSE